MVIPIVTSRASLGMVNWELMISWNNPDLVELTKQVTAETVSDQSATFFDWLPNVKL